MTKPLVLLLALCAPALSQKLYWSEQTPKLARAGDRVKVRFRIDGITRLVFEQEGGGSVEGSVVGAGLYEVEVVARPIEPRHLFQRYMGLVRLYNGATALGAANLSLRYADGLPAVRLTQLAADAQRSDSVLNISMRGFYDALVSPSGTIVFSNDAVMRRAYQLLPDDFDFINIIVGTVSVTENRYHAALRNNVTGLGQQIFDNAASTGSARKLIGMTMFPIPGYFDGAEEAFVHEHGHQWVNYSKAAPFSTGAPHWPISSMATGVMGWSDPVNYQGLNLPCKFTPQADGSVLVQTEPNPRKFNDYDLYLIGLIDAADVSAQYVVTSAAKTNAAMTQSCDGLGRLAAGEFRRVDGQDLVAANGPRIPNASQSQKSFKVLNIVVSRDALLSAEEMSYIEVMARRAEERGPMPYNIGRAMGFSSPWFAATQGRSTMSSRISADTLPVISHGGVVNAGSYSGSAIGAGTVATIFGSDLARVTASASAVPLPDSLGGVKVIVNGIAAPLFYVSPTQINFQLPAGLPLTPVFGADGAYLAALRVERDGMTSNLAYVGVRAAAPGIIQYGNNYAVATTPDGGVIGPQTPVAPGQVITFYWVGSAPLSEALIAGAAAPSDRLVRVTGTTAIVQVNSQQQDVQFLGATPGGVGLFQANVRLGANLPDGELPMVLTIGGVASDTVKLVVKR